jgi:uncharacterized protein YqeY
MNLKEQIMNDIKAAMKAGETDKLTVLRGVNSSLKNAEIAKQMKAGASATLTDEEMLAVVTGEAKKRRDSIAAFTNAARPELAAGEQAELVILQAYLPKQLSSVEVEQAVDRIMSSSGLKEFGPLMKAVMAELKGRADGQMITDLIKKKLS